MYSIELLADGGYREYVDGSIAVASSYSLSSGRAFEFGDRIVPVIRMGDTEFFTLFSPDTSFAVKIVGDTLQLVTTGSDGWSHRFLRAGPGQ